MTPFYIFLGITALFCVFYLLLGYRIFSEFANRNKRKKEAMKQTGTETHNEFVASKKPEELRLKNTDGQTLFGTLLRAEKPRGATVLLLHGYLGDGISHMGMFAPFYLAQGFDVFLPDHRAHGRSGGTYIGFGEKDAEDCVLWCKHLLSLYPKGQKLLLHGVSMGGATACTAVSKNGFPKEVFGIVSDCAFSSCEEQFTHSLKFITPIPAKYLLPGANIFCKLLAGYDLYSASAKDAVSRSKTPILFIHGSEDTFVPTAMVNTLYDACAAEKKRVIIDGAPHFLSYQVNPSEYEKELLQFFEKIAI